MPTRHGRATSPRSTSGRGQGRGTSRPPRGGAGTRASGARTLHEDLRGVPRPLRRDPQPEPRTLGSSGQEFLARVLFYDGSGGRVPADPPGKSTPSLPAAAASCTCAPASSGRSSARAPCSPRWWSSTKSSMRSALARRRHPATRSRGASRRTARAEPAIQRIISLWLKWMSRGCPRPFPSRRPVLVREPPRASRPRPRPKAGRSSATAATPDRGPHRLGQDAGRLPLRHRRAVPAGRRPAPTRRRSSTSRRCARCPTTSRRTCRGRWRRSARSTRRCPRCACSCAPATRRPSERTAMAKRPPHILVTTPESLYLLLT